MWNETLGGVRTAGSRWETSHTVRHRQSARRSLRWSRKSSRKQRSLMRKRSNSTMTQVFSELSLVIRGKKLSDMKSTQWPLAIAARRQDTGDELLYVLSSPSWRIQQAWKVMNKGIGEKAKDDRMSNHAMFIAVKRQGRTVVCRSQGGPGQRERSGSRGTLSHSRNTIP